MTNTTLAIQTEAWLQEELCAQQVLLALLGRIEAAARGGVALELASGARELEESLSGSCAREARRAALLARLAAALGLSARDVSLSTLFARLSAQGIETARLERMRAELRTVVGSVVQAGRRMAALARYHRGFFEELCQLLSAGAADPDGHLVNARA